MTESRQPTLQDQAYASLRDALIEGAFPPGERLSLRRIAARLGVSAMPVRAAVRRLAAERAVQLLPSGAAVVPLLSRADYRELVRIRLLLEPEAARLAAPRATAALVAELAMIARAAAAARRDGDEDRYRTLDLSLHRTLYAAAAAPLLLATIEGLWVRRGALLRLARPLLRARGRDDHAAILAALRRRDQAALAAAVQDEIVAASELLLDSMRFPEDPPEAGLGALKRLRA